MIAADPRTHITDGYSGLFSHASSIQVYGATTKLIPLLMPGKAVRSWTTTNIIGWPWTVTPKVSPTPSLAEPMGSRGERMAGIG